MKYPEILTSICGNKIENVADWENFRRKELLSLFENFVYGVAPIDKPEDMTYNIKETALDDNIRFKKVTLSFDNFSFEADIFLPKTVSAPLPAFVFSMHQWEEENYDFEKEPNSDILPIPEVLARGYAVVVMKTSRICPDVFSGEHYKEGIFTALDCVRRGSSWSIIASWSWGAMRVMDYLETDNEIDEARVAIVGHSRSGKVALWAGAQDKRFKMVISNNSGCTGSAMTRGKQGEHIKDINDSFNWFCENYKSFNEREEMLPVDQHQLLALIAPRPLYITSSSEDLWADPNAELFSCRLASEVYELYGLEGVKVSDEGAKIDEYYQDGMIAYHNNRGGHCINRFDWAGFLDFADKNL